MASPGLDPAGLNQIASPVDAFIPVMVTEFDALTGSNQSALVVHPWSESRAATWSAPVEGSSDLPTYIHAGERPNN
jgi:hypothetical protein